jgi:hypothetical protein
MTKEKKTDLLNSSVASTDEDIALKFEMVAQDIHQNVPTVNTAIEILSKTDSIIKDVWEHYTEKDQTTPLNPHDVKYFWEKVTECFANLNDFKKNY